MADEIAAKVWMVSGCADEQTSADVSDVMSFGLPTDVGPGGAGGACTSAMAHKVTQNKQWVWGDLLSEMRTDLRAKKYTQIPQLSSSYNLSLSEPVNFKAETVPVEKTKALLIGINYVGHAQGVLSGCHNDVDTWTSIIKGKGFNPNAITILKDDGMATPPTRANIEQAMMRMVQSAQPGDALFMQYSGHGSQVKDVSGDEVSGLDQCLVPMDYQKSGVIIDDWLLDNVVKKLPANVTLFAVMDCCHSGTILDLPYSVVLNEAAAQQYAQNPAMMLPTNPDFLKKHKKKLAVVAAAGAAGCCVGGPAGCIAAMCAAVCGMAAAEHVQKQREAQAATV